MFCYSSLLVETGLVDEVNLSFLVVGHTHCNLDQEFSVHSRKISKSAWIGSPLAMQELYLMARKEAENEEEKTHDDDQRGRSKKMKSRITLGVQLQYIFDWKSFFRPVVNKNIKYFQVPHRFKISRVNEVAICQYMLFTDESLEKEEWLPPLGSFKSSDDPILQESFIKLTQLGVVNGLPDLKRFMGLKGDVSSYVSTSWSSSSHDTLTLANSLNDLMNDLLELEKTALAKQIVNMGMQGDGMTEAGADHKRLVTQTKADIQREMIRAANSKSGFIIWLDYRRDPNWDPFTRPNILPHLPTINDRGNEAFKKLIESARATASIANAMLLKLKHKGISLAHLATPSSTIQDVTSDYSAKVLHPMEKQWYEERETYEQVFAKSKSLIYYQNIIIPPNTNFSACFMICFISKRCASRNIGKTLANYGASRSRPNQ